MGNYYGVVWSYNGNSLSHHGIKGQRWGIRRYQNEDGTLTDEGRRHLLYSTSDKSSINRHDYRVIRKDGKAEEREFRKERRAELKGTHGAEREKVKKYYAELESGMAKSRAVLEKNAGHDMAAVRFSKKADKLEAYARSGQAKLSNNPDTDLKNFDKLSKEDRKAASDQIFRKMDNLVKNGDDSKAEQIGFELSDKISTILGKDGVDYYGEGPIHDLNKSAYDLDSSIRNRRSEIEKEIGYKNIPYSSNDGPKDKARKEKQRTVEWDRLMKAIHDDPKIQKMCSDQKSIHESLLNKIIEEVGLTDSESTKEWIGTLILGSINPYTYDTYISK